MTLLAEPDEADAWVLGQLGRRIDDAPVDPRVSWAAAARPDQLLPDLADPWRVFFIRGGRGSGKTRSGAQALAQLVQDDPDGEGEYGIVAPTLADAWTKCVEGESGILRAFGTSYAEVRDGNSRLVKHAYRSYEQVVMRSGIVIYLDGADEGGLRIQGRNLKAAWCDEIGLWQKWDVAWNESLRYAVRMGVSRIICTGTPKVSQPARKLVRSLLQDAPEHGGVISRRLRTVDNRANLSDEFYRAVVGASKGTRLEQQELEGVLLEDVANALWTRDQLDECQCPAVGAPGGPPMLFGAKIGVDPSDGAEDSDEQAYTVIGKGHPDDHHLYVAKNWGGQEAPAPFTRRVILEAIRWDAEILVEKNHGGAWLTTTFALVMKILTDEGFFQDKPRPRVRVVHASQAKRTRAEPISAMYLRRAEDGTPQVRHCKMTEAGPDGQPSYVGMVELEDQMVTFLGAQGERSPDRLDSLVWALDPYRNINFGPPGTAGKRDWAADEGELLDAAGGNLALPSSAVDRAHADKRLAEAHGGHYDRAGGDWSLDGFGPKDDESERRMTRPRRNVRAWR